FALPPLPPLEPERDDVLPERPCLPVALRLRVASRPLPVEPPSTAVPPLPVVGAAVLVPPAGDMLLPPAVLLDWAAPVWA
ncbi:hypothetical protein, partial [Escherichia coli]|uniref:hypothetical protein n=1 Tax=Escherichia coli TaxID=562 RepID=UPI001F4A3C94